MRMRRVRVPRHHGLFAAFSCIRAARCLRTGFCRAAKRRLVLPYLPQKRNLGSVAGFAFDSASAADFMKSPGQICEPVPRRGGGNLEAACRAVGAATWKPQPLSSMTMDKVLPCTPKVTLTSVAAA